MTKTFSYTHLSVKSQNYIRDMMYPEDGEVVQIGQLRKGIIAQDELDFMAEVHDKELANPGETFCIEF